MSELIIVTFDGQYTADEVLLRLRTMEEKWEVGLDEVAVLTLDKSGRTRLRHSNDLAAGGFLGGGAVGGLWGLLIGALAANPAAGLIIGGVTGSALGTLGGALEEADEEDEFAARVGRNLKPDSSALAIIGWADRPVKLLKTLEEFEGKVIETSLSVSDEKALREALRAKEPAQA